MKGFFKSILFLTVITTSAISINAAENHEDGPNISYGLSANFGISTAVQSKGTNQYKPGISYGCDFIFEKMFSNTLGLHSGISFAQLSSSYLQRGLPDTWIEVITRSLSLPVYMITSINKNFFSFNLLCGFYVSYLFEAEMINPGSIPGGGSADILKYLNHYQFGTGVGINFKFRINHFFDLFFGLSTEFSFIDLIAEKGNDKTYDHLINGKFNIGFLFRTNPFPIEY